MLDTVLQKKLDAHREKQLYRVRQIRQPQQANLFCSSDYLGLSQHSHVIQALQKGAEQYGFGSTASQIICGYTQAHQELENAFAEFLGTQKALLFGNGYMANIGVLQAIIQRKDLLLQDKLCHASLIDAAQLSTASLLRYPHRDLTVLANQLSQPCPGHKLIITDGVFSMDGDIADLPALITLAKQHQAWLMVDDAHGLGVLGQHGRGCFEHYGVDVNNIDVLVCPLGKAIGGYGAIVAGSQTLIEALQQFARTAIYTTAIPPALACAVLASLRLLQQESWRRETLWQNIAYFKQCALEYELPIIPSDTPIQILLIGDSYKTMQIAQYLREHNFWVGAIRPPTVAVNSARLRISLSCLHDKRQIQQLLTHLRQAYDTFL